MGQCPWEPGGDIPDGRHQFLLGLEVQCLKTSVFGIRERDFTHSQTQSPCTVLKDRE